MRLKVLTDAKQAAAVTLADKKPLGKWFSLTPLSLLLFLIMSRFHWISKDVHEDRDITSDSKLSTVTVRSSPEVIYSGERTTSRRELWCFYLYSISYGFLFLLFPSPFFIIDQKSTKVSPDSDLVHLRSRRTRISSIMLAMT
jgi:hypothetical protein